MINFVQTAQLVGIVSILMLFAVQLYFVVYWKTHLRTARIAMLWTAIYVFFLFILRSVSLMGLGTMDQLRIVSGFASLIPLVFVISHLVMDKPAQDLEEARDRPEGG